MMPSSPRAATVAVVVILLPSLSTALGPGSQPENIPAETPGSESAKVPLGFTPHSFESERRLEQRYLKIPSSARTRKFLRRLTREPHVAGTPGDRRVTQFIYDEFKRDGLNPEIVEYRVLLSYPKKVAVDLVAPVALKLASPEPPIRGDKETRVSDPLARMPWNGYSPSADLTRPVVYANYGTPDDYDQLRKLGVSVRDKLVLVRYFHGYRGGKNLEAERRGAAGVIVYSDPAEDGTAQGKTYPEGPWGPLGHFQRGAVVYDFLVPGDPLTPGWASTQGARRIPESESRILPKIPMVPMSAADAREILSRLRGTEAPQSWQGALGFTYHLGDDATRVHLGLDMENRVTPIWDVIGRIRGSAEPEKLVVLSNHHDAWVYGAVDPSSGTAAMLETARAFGKLLKRGFRPRRTILFGSWDAEEYTLTGSTEWGEQFADDLERNAVVCLNVDAATSGSDFTLSAVPALVPAVIEATEAVRDPNVPQSIYQRWSTRRTVADVRSYAVPGATGGPVAFGVLGGGSDFMVFLQHDGVPSLDMIFDGPYGVYHSVYDDFDWMARYGDPGFRYHAAMSRVWGLLALRFANAGVLPLDYSIYASEVSAYLRDLKKLAPAEFTRVEIEPLIEKCQVWHDAAARVREQISALNTPDSALPAINTALMAEERALLKPGGIPGRPWFRHLVYAPLPTYEAETLPGLREALVAKDLERARVQARDLGTALDRAIATLNSIP
ncbi:MAG TPA: M28 family metallopeptidase [Terriglobia bacterium]|nr:M28 family metallopeptidase [Terriglobia bacterium]